MSSWSHKNCWYLRQSCIWSEKRWVASLKLIQNWLQVGAFKRFIHRPTASYNCGQYGKQSFKLVFIFILMYLYVQQRPENMTIFKGISSICQQSVSCCLLFVNIPCVTSTRNVDRVFTFFCCLLLSLNCDTSLWRS